jgi:mRNA interferase RelE/StbE
MRYLSNEANCLYCYKRSSVGKLSPDVRGRIDKRLTDFAQTRHGDVKRLKGREGLRLRIGDWRVVLYEEQDTIVVAAVGHRREIYE